MRSDTRAQAGCPLLSLSELLLVESSPILPCMHYLVFFFELWNSAQFSLHSVSLSALYSEFVPFSPSLHGRPAPNSKSITQPCKSVHKYALNFHVYIAMKFLNRAHMVFTFSFSTKGSFFFPSILSKTKIILHLFTVCMIHFPLACTNTVISIFFYYFFLASHSLLFLLSASILYPSWAS